jgi:hypothetical protein
MHDKGGTKQDSFKAYPFLQLRLIRHCIFQTVITFNVAASNRAPALAEVLFQSFFHDRFCVILVKDVETLTPCISKMLNVPPHNLAAYRVEGACRALQYMSYGHGSCTWAFCLAKLPA